jgi:hypothetical protein
MQKVGGLSLNTLYNVSGFSLPPMEINHHHICFESQKQFFTYLATVTITGDRAANVDLSLALTAFGSEGSFTCHTYSDMGLPFLCSYLKDPLLRSSDHDQKLPIR